MAKKPKVFLSAVPHPAIVFVSGDDWEGMYLDGELVDEGHSLNVFKVLEKLGLAHEIRDLDSEWIEERGSLPDYLKDVMFDGEDLG